MKGTGMGRGGGGYRSDKKLKVERIEEKLSEQRCV
jgi:hypothetical protein